MTHTEKRIARFIKQLEQRVTDLEQGRPPDAPEMRVSNISEDGVAVGDTMTGTQKDSIAPNALDFSGLGTQDYVDTGSDMNDPQQFTVTFFVELDALDVDANNNYRHIVNAGTNFILIEQDGDVSFRVPGVDTSNFKAGNVSLSTVTHVACRYDQSDRDIFVDGSFANGQTIGSGTVNFGNITIGGAHPDHNPDGRIQDVRVYPSALSDADIASISNGEEVLGWYARYLMMEGTGSTAWDTRGHMNHGTITGATWTSPGIAPTPTEFTFMYDLTGQGYSESEWQ